MARFMVLRWSGDGLFGIYVKSDDTKFLPPNQYYMGPGHSLTRGPSGHVVTPVSAQGPGHNIFSI